jgi:hypothetical protein
MNSAGYRYAAGDHRSEKCQHHLRSALGPTQALPPQATQRLRHQDPDDGVRLVNHAPARQLYPPGDVNVVGDRVRRPPTRVFQGPLAKSAYDPADREEAAIHRLRPPNEPDNRCKFADLQFAQHRGAVTNAGVAPQPSDIASAKSACDPMQRLWIEQRIAVDA